MHVNEISFSYERLSNKTRFEKEADGNSEMCSIPRMSQIKKKPQSSSTVSELSSAEYEELTKEKSKMKILDTLRLRLHAALTRFCRHRCVDTPLCTEREDASATASLRRSCQTEPKVLLRLKLPQRNEKVFPCSNS